MISLAGRDIVHSWSKFVLTGLGLGLLIGVTLTMAGVYRGMVDDAKALLNNSGADLWVVQQDTQGPYAESSSIHDDVYRSIRALPGVARAANVTYLTMQVRRGKVDARAMVVGFEPGQPGEPGYLIAGRHITRNHYEAVVDVKTGFQLGDLLRIIEHAEHRRLPLADRQPADRIAVESDVGQRRRRSGAQFFVERALLDAEQR